MFGIDFSEILVIFGIALVVLGPEKLPKLAATIGKWLGRARAMARQFREQLEQEASRVQNSVDLNAHRAAQAPPYPPPPGTAYPGHGAPHQGEPAAVAPAGQGESAPDASSPHPAGQSADAGAGAHDAVQTNSFTGVPGAPPEAVTAAPADATVHALADAGLPDLPPHPAAVSEAGLAAPTPAPASAPAPAPAPAPRQQPTPVETNERGV